MTIEFKKRMSMIALGVLTVILSGCNTIHGMGEDLAVGGKAISSAATDVQDGGERQSTTQKNTVSVSPAK